MTLFTAPWEQKSSRLDFLYKKRKGFCCVQNKYDDGGSPYILNQNRGKGETEYYCKK